jgi:hypothetical protein
MRYENRYEVWNAYFRIYLFQLWRHLIMGKISKTCLNIPAQGMCSCAYSTDHYEMVDFKNMYRFLISLLLVEGSCPDVWDCSIWIGAEDVGNKRFVWSDSGQTLEFSRWRTKEPTGGEGCVILSREGTWNDYYCYFKQWFVCENNKWNIL